MSLVLPKLVKAKFSGYNPIFDSTIEVNVKNSLLILLGGNGLGKTTLLQSIIYALGGSLDNKIETVPERRWTRKYFKDRLSNSDSSFVEVEFKLRKDLIRIKRGFQSDRLIDFFINGSDASLNDDPEIAFEKYLISSYNYDSLASFRFLIHKLCFLSEKRENLVWDTETQTRILMLIFSDANAEKLFRDKSDQLQKIDSKIRHLQVDINKIKSRLEKEKASTKESEKKNKIPKNNKKDEEITELRKTYLDVVNAKFDLQKEVKQYGADLSLINSEIEDIQEKITQNEQIFIYKQITNFESKEAKLAIHKLIHHKLCPACGCINEELYEKAITFITQTACPLCGTSQENDVKNIAPGLEAELEEKIKHKIEVESKFISVEERLYNLQIQESNLLYSINEYMLESPTVIFVKNYDSNTTNNKDLQRTLSNYEGQQADFKFKFDRLKTELDEEYNTFRTKNNERLQQLSDKYKEYATEFLGISCQLISIDNKSDFLELKRFVPSFNDIVRYTPESCSEAQRFFLDIAFRMALIEMVCVISDTSATFICETPENALDITYRNNVADMFRVFMKKKNTIVLSSNIQPEGIAESLIFHIPKEKRVDSVLNFLEIGKLSNVQQAQKSSLTRIVKKILNQK